MTITINEEDYSRLKDSLRVLTEENKEQRSQIRTLENKVKTLEESELVKRSVRLAEILCFKYIRATMNDLGVEIEESEDAQFSLTSRFSDGLRTHLINDPYDIGRFKVESRLEITEAMKTYFIKVGLAPLPAKVLADRITLPELNEADKFEHIYKPSPNEHEQHSN